ncbi:MAG TPA: hypothetical protein VIW24_23875 [Aldersonia sp.]
MSRLAEYGINFPAVGGRRSSTAVGTRICAEAVASLDPALAERILGETDWRHRYPQHIGDLGLVEARSESAALTVAERGLAAAYAEFVTVSERGDLSLDSAHAAADVDLETIEVVGTGEPSRELVIPYRGQRLRGSALLRQLDDWVARGITEPSFAEALGAVVRNPDWLDLSDRTFGLFGAGSQMGPFSHLMSWGARVAVLGTVRPTTGERLQAIADSSAGRMLTPVQRTGTAASAATVGVDLVTQTGLLQRWLAEVPGPLTLGNYGYLDGADFVRLSMAFDVCFTGLRRGRDDVSLAYLATPADVFLVPGDAVREAQRRYTATTPAQVSARGVHLLSRGRYLRPNYSGASVADTGAGFGLVNAIIPEQGPNYALAKRLQRWRIVLARAAGVLTSVHTAPPTKTQSVHSNPVMERRQRLTARLGIETFEAATSQAIGAAILVHDLRNPDAPANPKVRLEHPHEIFMFAANPGGRWRVPLEPASSVPVLQALDTIDTRARSVARRVARIRHNGPDTRTHVG